MKINNLINKAPGYAIYSIENMGILKITKFFFKKFKTAKQT